MYVDLAAMLLHHDVVAHRQPQSGPLAGRLGGEERVEHFLLYLERDSGAVVADPDFNRIAEAFRGRAQGRLKTVDPGLLAFGGGIKAVRDQIEEDAGDFLRIEIDHAGLRIEVALERDVEAGFLRARAVVGEIEALLDDRIDLGGPVLAGARTRMQQHVLDDRIGALAVLHDFFEIALQHMRELADLLARLVVELDLLEHVIHFVDQLGRYRREIVDEIQRVLDFVRDARSELAERSQLFSLYQAVLRGTQFFER